MTHAALAARYADDLARFARRRFGAALGEDIAQETWIAVLRNPAPAGDPWSWLWRFCTQRGRQMVGQSARARDIRGGGRDGWLRGRAHETSLYGLIEQEDEAGEPNGFDPTASASPEDALLAVVDAERRLEAMAEHERAGHLAMVEPEPPLCPVYRQRPSTAYRKGCRCKACCETNRLRYLRGYQRNRRQRLAAKAEYREAHREELALKARERYARSVA